VTLLTFLTIWLIASRALLRSVAVVPFRLWLTTAFVSGVILGSLLSAQVDDEKERPPKQDESEQIGAHSSPSPKPKKSPAPVAKASKDKSGKKKAPARNGSHSDAGGTATSEKVPTAIPHAKLANDKSAKVESTSDDNESGGEQESSRARKAKI